ncbi:MAG: hypothetical protein ACFCUI_00045 [Bernardetiaceae bacterium]
MLTVIAALVFVGLFFGLMTIRLILLKKGEFRGTCASQSPFLQKGDGACGYCGKPAGEACPNEKVPG